MVRENMRSPRAELEIRLARNFRVLFFESGSNPDLRRRDAPNQPPPTCSYLLCVRCVMCTKKRGVSSNGRAAALHAAGKGIDAPILH